MKKGCFLTAFIVLVIIIFGVVYVIRYHGDELLNKGKEQVLSLAEDKISEELNSVEETDYKDSLQVLINNYFEKLASLKPKDAIEKIDAFSSNVQIILKDHKIDPDEFSFLKKFMDTNAK